MCGMLERNVTCRRVTRPFICMCVCEVEGGGHLARCTCRSGAGLNYPRGSCRVSAGMLVYTQTKPKPSQPPSQLDIRIFPKLDPLTSPFPCTCTNGVHVLTITLLMSVPLMLSLITINKRNMRCKYGVVVLSGKPWPWSADKI